MAAEEMKMPGINEEVKNGVGVGPNGPGAAGEAAKPTVPKKGDDVSIRYRGLSYEMAVELQYYEEEYFFWDKEVPFGEKLKIYPVNVKDYNRFMDAVSCFLLDKKTLPPNAKPEDIKKQLKMTELEYMLSKMNNSEWIMRLSHQTVLILMRWPCAFFRLENWPMDCLTNFGKRQKKKCPGE